MNELETLIQQKNDLLAKIRQINESCEGIDNEDNAQRVMELNGRQSELVAAKNELAGKLSALEAELASVNKNIRDISGGGVERILQAIKNQRWFFFKNKPKVLMDRDTALLWPNLTYYNCCKDNKGNYYNFNDSYDIINSYNFDGITMWDIPTRDELVKLLGDYSFPYCRHRTSGNSHELISPKGFIIHRLRVTDYKNTCIMLYSYNGAYYRIQAETGHTEPSCWLPRSRMLVNDIDYENNISPSNNFYSETEKLQFTLNIFVENGLIPLFNDAAITQLYRQIYVDKPELMRQLEEINAQITELQKNQIVLTANFDYKPLLRKYGAAAVDKSAIKYSAAVAGVAEELLDALQEYEAAQAETIAEFARLTENLSAPHAEFLLKRLDFGFDDARAQILSVKAQAENLAARLDKINRGEDSISRLAALETEPRASFEFLVENLAQIILGVQRKVDFFAVNKNFVTALINTLENWDEDFLPVVEFALKGNLIDADDSPAAIRILSLLKEYKANADFDSEKFQQAIQEIISTRSKATEKIFLQDWLKTIFSA